MKRTTWRGAVVATALAGVVLGGGCSSSSGGSDGGSGSAGGTTAVPQAWDEAGLAQGKQLAEKVRASPLGCGDFNPDPLAMLAVSYQKVNIPLPLASGTCVRSPSEEQITIEVFVDPAAAKAFVEAKGATICAKGEKLDSPEAPFPGLPYVDGGSWIIEPDFLDTNIKLPEAVGGTATNMCVGKSAAPGTLPDGTPSGTAPASVTTMPL